MYLEFHMVSGGLDPSSHDCSASTLSTEPPPSLLPWFMLQFRLCWAMVWAVFPLAAFLMCTQNASAGPRLWTDCFSLPLRLQIIPSPVRDLDMFNWACLAVGILYTFWILAPFSNLWLADVFLMLCFFFSPWFELWCTAVFVPKTSYHFPLLLMFLLLYSVNHCQGKWCDFPPYFLLRILLF